MILEPERALIGALMMEPQAVKDCARLRSDMFADNILGRVYLEYVRAYDFGYPANLVTIAEKFSDLPQEIFLKHMKECSDSTVTSAAAGKYAEAVINAYKARTATQMIQAAEFQPVSAERQIGQLINELETLQEDNLTGIKNLRQIVDEVSSEYFTDREGIRLYTGFSRLDHALGGLEGGDVIVIGARPAVGKSAFVTQILMQMGQAGKRVLLYNLEMREKQVYERMLSRQSGIRLNRVRRGKSFLEDEESQFHAANLALKKLDVWISSGVKSVSEIRRESRHMDADCIIIDYLQLIRADRHYTNRASEVGDISKAIKALAMELNCPIIVLSQLNRLSEGRGNKEPTMAELRESGDIEQDASVIILLWNLDDADRSRKGLKVEKNRQGEQTKFCLEFLGDAMCFKETDAAWMEFTKQRMKTPFDDD